MPDSGAMLLAIAALSNFVGWVGLSLAIDTHWRQVWNSAAPSAGTRIRLRLIGGMSFLAGAVCCALADRPSMAALVWLMLLVATAPLVAMLLAWRPRWLRILCLVR